MRWQKTTLIISSFLMSEVLLCVGLPSAFAQLPPKQSAPNQAVTTNFVPAPSVEQSANNGSSTDDETATSLSPTALGAKAILEDLLIRRYSQDLSTLVSKEAFSLGARIELIEVPKKARNDQEMESEPISDLMLGTIDPEQLAKRFSESNEKVSLHGMLANYRIKSVTMSVGLSKDLPPQIKRQTQDWLQTRVRSEFGGVGTGSVSSVTPAPQTAGPTPKPVGDENKNNPKPTDEKPEDDKTDSEKRSNEKTTERVTADKEKGEKTLLDYISQFQPLIGQTLLAFAMLLGVLLWKLMKSTTFSEINQKGGSLAINGPMAEGGRETQREQEERRTKEKTEQEQERMKAAEEMAQLSRELKEIIPRVSTEFENVVWSWCQVGETGREKVACLAEAVGKDVGKLPIPPDAMADVYRTFTKMTDLSLPKKRDVLKKAYWDLLSALNLGADFLNTPFAYMGTLKPEAINHVLIDQNPRMKTLVSLYMPEDLRGQFVSLLNRDEKIELLQSAAELNAIEATELRVMDSQLLGMTKMNAPVEMVPLDTMLGRLVAVLSPIEEVTLLTGLTGPAVERFKQTTPCLAFLGDWPEEKLQGLMLRSNFNEVVALGRVRPDLKDKTLAACPPMMARMARDDLSREDSSSELEKNERLRSLTLHIKEMIEAHELNLELLFPNKSESATKGNVSDFSKAS